MSDATIPTARRLATGEQASWRAYVEMNAALAARLNREMQEQAGISIADFSVLVQLSEHLDARMRVLELARALGWEKSRLSHQLTRMQQRGLVERSYCSEDRRGAFVVLTGKGRDTVVAAAPRHVESLRRYVFDSLSADQIEALGVIARTVTGVVTAACAGREDACEDACD